MNFDRKVLESDERNNKTRFPRERWTFLHHFCHRGPRYLKDFPKEL